MARRNRNRGGHPHHHHTPGSTPASGTPTVPTPTPTPAAPAAPVPAVPVTPAKRDFTQAEADAVIAKLPADDVVPPLDLSDVANEPPPPKPTDPVTPGCKAIPKPTYTVVQNDRKTTIEAVLSIVVVLLPIFTVCLFILSGIGMQWVEIGQPQWKYPLSLLTTFLFAISTYEYVTVRADTQTALVFNDNLSKERLVVYAGGGFALRPWWFSPFKSIPTIDLQKDQVATEEFEVTTKNGVKFKMRVEFLWKPLISCVAQYLGFAPTIIQSRTKAVIQDRVNRIAGKNEWESIANNRGDMANSVSSIFGKDSEQSEFEEHFGIIVLNPKILTFEPVGPESTALVNGLFRARLLAKEIRILQANIPGISNENALKTALLTLETKGFIDKNVSIVASPNIKSVFMDDDRRTT